MAVEGHFKSFDGGEFYERRWLVEGEPRANLLIIHGFGEHCGRYDAIAEYMNEAGLNVYGLDLRWHGRSPGKRGHVEDFSLFLRDLDAWRAHLADALEGKPLLVLAHSMGGLLCTTYLEQRDFHPDAVVFSSSFLAMEDVSPTLLAVAGILSKLTPWLPVATLDSTAVSRDPEVVAAYQNDPLVYHGKINARTGEQFNTAVGRARVDAAKITAPAYIIHGSDDRLVPHLGSEYLHKHISSTDKTIEIYKNGYHELMNDVIRDEVLAPLRAWLLAHA